MGEVNRGDWHCSSCGYLTWQRVSVRETCTTCGAKVHWHEVGALRLKHLAANRNITEYPDGRVQITLTAEEWRQIREAAK